MRPVGLRAPAAAIGRRGALLSSRSLAPIFQGAMIAVMSAGLLWLVWIYGNALRDPRYLDGWLLAGGMVLQILFHVANRKDWLSPKSAARWRTFHVFLGYLLIAAFISHSDFSMPDTGLEWTLSVGFVLVALSGVFGIYLAWSLRTRHGLGEHPGYDRIPARRAELARDVRLIVNSTDPDASEGALPAAPYDAWIKDLYACHLQAFFEGPRNLASHLVGSQRPRYRLTDEIDNLSRYVDKRIQDKLATIRGWVVEKDRDDFALVHLGLARAWPYLHVPVTYGMIVLTVVHVLVVYAFSSGDW